MTGALRSEVIDLRGADRIVAAWKDLARRCLEPSVFNEPAFALAAARHLGHARPPVFLVVWADTGELLALCPVRSSRLRPLLIARQWTHAQATEAFPMLDRTCAPAALASLLAGLSRLAGAASATLWAGLPETGLTAALIRDSGRAFARFDPRSRAVLLRDGAPTLISSKSRKEMRRQERRLAEQGGLDFASFSGGEIGSALRQFLDLEAQGWKGQRGTALGSRTDTGRFVTEAVTALAADGHCRIDSLELAGRPIAMGIILRSGERAFYWKTAYDESLARFSPGVQLTSHITERQLGEDVAWTDSCAIPGHSMIDRLWSDRMQVADYLVSLPARSSSAFRVACFAEGVRRSLRGQAKTVKSLLRR